MRAARLLAVSFVADQAAAVLTFGIAEAAEALVITAAKECVKFLEQQLEQLVIGKVLEAAVDWKSTGAARRSPPL